MAAVTHHLGGDSLVDGADCTGVRQQSVVGVTMDVDESRGDQQSGSVQFLTLASGQIPYRRDTVTHNADVGR